MFFLPWFSKRHDMVETPIDDLVQLSDEKLASVIESLHRHRVPMFESCKYTIRTGRHTLAWAGSYIRAEVDELEQEFVTSTKGYHIVLIVDQLGYFAKVAFRLTTVGLAGYTEYGIEIRRTGEYFACKE